MHKIKAPVKFSVNIKILQIDYLTIIFFKRILLVVEYPHTSYIKNNVYI